MEEEGGGGSRSASASGNDDRVREWEDGLPTVADLTPLSQCLISPQLASAFSITSDIPPCRSAADVSRASHSMFSILKNTPSLPPITPPPPSPSRPHTQFRQHLHVNVQAHTPIPPELTSTPRSFLPHSIGDENEARPPAPDDEVDAPVPGSDSSENRSRHDVDADVEPEEVDSAPAALDNSTEDPSARTLKRPRLVWYPELHKRFIEAVAHLGIKNAVPKTIMQLMNVEGLTRENVASHLQKYRLYLKRMQGLSTEGPTSSDHLFASTPVPPDFAPSTRFYAGVPAHLEEVMQVPFANPHAPVPMGMGHPDGATVAGSFAPVDPFAYSTYVRPPPPHRFVQGYPKEIPGTRENKSASSSHHILRLFPTRK
ncbi:hypothetical protein L7F22_026697 [Adiantum nelumboides]|nr:hypothetical protein [Adiantum nelumboides]MCO5572936.1 hypothetical protein [Adiantum nelumboides]